MTLLLSDGWLDDRGEAIARPKSLLMARRRCDQTAYGKSTVSLVGFVLGFFARARGSSCAAAASA